MDYARALVLRRRPEETQVLGTRLLVCLLYLQCILFYTHVHLMHGVRIVSNLLTKRAFYSLTRLFATTPYLNFNTMNRDNLVWVDLEMTGLDPDTCHIIEMSCLITDADLNIIAEAPNVVIHQSDEVLNEMGEWCKKHHEKSGLTAAVKASNITLKRAEEIMVDFVKRYVPPHDCPLAGNSVHEDRRFLKKYMPTFMDHLHYRIVDVSSIKELCRRWHPKIYKEAPRKALNHRAPDDIKESIRELQYYKKTVFK
ncbi:oligoribonuclease, mitochondrial-like [Actinia tenebrosa]|uniref:Oligoribonuclease, mitochondrial-like n=1 Tax=Actinia tenebrosa TaxID=6105 RepID=A0A6P8HRE7_ACTTE|nr:oligoribonuclease, mitochondrial-like [Actinia tenebrosa]